MRFQRKYDDRVSTVQGPEEVKIGANASESAWDKMCFSMDVSGMEATFAKLPLKPAYP